MMNIKGKRIFKVFSWLERNGGFSSAFERFHVLGMIEHFADKFDIGAMCRFITWAEENGQSASFIRGTLGHDLNGVDDPFFSPRTSGY